MNKKHQIGFISFVSILLVQIFIPKIYLGLDIYITPDIILIYMVYLSSLYSRYYIILFGFCLGLLQDIISQTNLFGLFAFNKTISGYILGTIGLYDKIWNNGVKILFMFCAFFTHFFIAYYMMYDRSLTPFTYIFRYAFLQSFVSIILVLVVNRFILIDNKIIN